MIKKKATVIVSTLCIFLPVLIGILLWDRLPEQIPNHWGIDGQVDGWSSKEFAVFAQPCILAAVHWLCIFASSMDPKRKAHESKMGTLVLWISPMISLVMGSVSYTTAMGYALLDISLIMCILLGVMFVVLGNYLPKCRHNYTMGIRLPWTLADEANWNATHRMAGWVWILCGVLMIATAFLGNFWILPGIMVVAVLVPVVYSYCYYRKCGQKEKES